MYTYTYIIMLLGPAYAYITIYNIITLQNKMQIIILLLCYLIYTLSKIRRRQIQHGFVAKRSASGNVLNTIIFVRLQFHCDS